jgi:hypothetical protein
MFRDVLVQRIFTDDHHYEGRVIPSARTARLLTKCHRASWVARHNRDIERADVNPEFEGICRYDCSNGAVT